MHDSQLIWILVIAVIGIFNWLKKKSAEMQEYQRKQLGADHELEQGLEPEELVEEPLVPHQILAKGDHQADQESMRKLMDALGLPQESPPPLPVPPQPVVIQPAPTLVESKWTLPKMEVKSEMIPGAQALAERFQKSAKLGAPPAAALSGVREMLARPGSLRDAVILREILGPPKGLSL